MSQLFAFFDDKAMYFMPPVAAPNAASMMRSLRAAAAENVDAPFVRHPNDFILYEIGTFDDSTGLVDGKVVPVRVATFSEIFAQFPT